MWYLHGTQDASRLPWSLAHPPPHFSFWHFNQNAVRVSSVPRKLSSASLYFPHKNVKEFGLSSQKASVPANLVNSFAHFKILEKQSLFPARPPHSRASYPHPSLQPHPSASSGQHHSWACPFGSWHSLKGGGFTVQGYWVHKSGPRDSGTVTFLQPPPPSLCTYLKQLEGRTSVFTF